MLKHKQMLKCSSWIGMLFWAKARKYYFVIFLLTLACLLLQLHCWSTPSPSLKPAYLPSSPPLRVEGAPLLRAGRGCCTRASALELWGFPAAQMSNLMAVLQAESDAGLIPGWFQVSLAGRCAANTACRSLQPLCSTWERCLCALSA